MTTPPYRTNEFKNKIIDKPGKYPENNLEAKLNLTRTLSNHIVIFENRKEILYHGRAYDLHFSGGLDIRGGASLRKYERITNEKTKIKIVQWLPPKFKCKKVKKFKFKDNIWGLYTDSHYYYFISNGKPTTGYDCHSHYRAELIGKAANNGLKLSHKLFDLVFGPIDARIMEMYKQSRDMI